jgi:hypothetical protein
VTFFLKIGYFVLTEWDLGAIIWKLTRERESKSEQAKRKK